MTLAKLDGQLKSALQTGGIEDFVGNTPLI